MSSQISKIAKAMGLKVIDARQDLTLTVAKGDIKQGTRREPRLCALAQCVARQEKTVNRVYVGRKTAHLFMRNEVLRYIVSKAAAEFLKAFDRGQKVSAGTYRLAKPTGSYTLAAAQERSKARPGCHKPAAIATGINRKPERVKSGKVTAGIRRAL